jgi:uncharacterized membrane protein YbhN (UPF0104 family)/membrane-associated phospholipid phosphatase
VTSTAEPRAIRDISRPPPVTTGSPWAPLPRVRHLSDGLRMALGALVVVVSAILTDRAVPAALEVNGFRLINQLPDFLGPAMLGVMQLGALGAVPVFAVVAVLGRRVRLAPLLLAAGATSWAVARALQMLVDEDPPTVHIQGVLLRGAHSVGVAFPATHVAVVAALVTAARGELSRPARRLAWLVVALVAVARIYVGAHLPIDVVGGLAVGWVMGAAVNLTVGVTPNVPDATQLKDALARSGRPDALVRPVGIDRQGMARFLVEECGETHLIKAVGHDDPESDWLRRAWRLVAFRQLAGDRGLVSATHRVDHEAYVSLLAQRAGVCVPPLVATWSAGPTELLERSWVTGRTLENLDGDAVDQTTLLDLWRQVALLESLGVACGSLPPDQVIVDETHHPWLVELGDARAGAPAEALRADRAAILAHIGLQVGPARATASLATVFGREAVAETLPALQPVALPKQLRRRLGRQPDALDCLRQEVARIAGVDAPKTSTPTVVAAKNLIPAAVAAGAVYFLLAHLGQAGATASALRGTNPVWLGGAVLAAALTYVLAATVLIAAAPVKLLFGRTVAAQLAAASANRASPAGLGGMGLNMRYLEANGASRPAAAGTVALTSSIGFVVHLAMTVTVAIVAGRSLHLRLGPDLEPSWPLLTAIIAGSTLVGAAVWFWRLHHGFLRLARSASAGATTLFRHPTRIATALLASAGISLAYTLALTASVSAAGGHLSLLDALIVYVAGSAVAALAPTPGGLGVLEAALIAGLSQRGISTGTAVAGVLTYRVVTYWLPVLPGLFCVAALRRRRAL